MTDSMLGTCGMSANNNGPAWRRATAAVARSTAWAAILLFGTACLSAADAPPIDIQRAKQLNERVQKGEKLSPEDQAYLDRVREEVHRRQQQGDGKDQAGKSTKPGR
jgi:hypothetical protein